MDTRILMRSKLFIPGSDVERGLRAMGSGADVIAIDLQDMIPAGQKSAARSGAKQMTERLRTTGWSKPLILRVNGLGTETFWDDLAVLETPFIDTVNLPDVEDAEAVSQLVKELERIERSINRKKYTLLLNIESVRGLHNAAEIATCSERIMGLQIGYADLMLSLGSDTGNTAIRSMIRGKVLFAAALGGVQAFDGIYTLRDDEAGLRRDCEQARGMGLAGRTCLFEEQIEIVNRSFGPSRADIEWARKVVGLVDGKTEGVFVLDGEFIDKPFIERAHRILAQAATNT